MNHIQKVLNRGKENLPDAYSAVEIYTTEAAGIAKSHWPTQDKHVYELIILNKNIYRRNKMELGNTQLVCIISNGNIIVFGCE